MTVRELITELLHADMDAQVWIAYKKGEFENVDDETIVRSIRASELGDDIYFCGQDRKTDFCGMK